MCQALADRTAPDLGDTSAVEQAGAVGPAQPCERDADVPLRLQAEDPTFSLVRERLEQFRYWRRTGYEHSS